MKVGYIAGKVEAWAASKLLSNVAKGEKYIEGAIHRPRAALPFCAVVPTRYLLKYGVWSGACVSFFIFASVGLTDRCHTKR